MNLEKEFLPYEQALALKELGFDEWCYKVYEKNSRLCNTYESTRWQNENPELVIGAPLYQQAFRWFRDKYNIQGYIYSSTVRGNSEKTKQFTGYIWNINGIDMPFISTDARDELHDTYEEAELACLIKLIEIVKEK